MPPAAELKAYLRVADNQHGFAGTTTVSGGEALPQTFS
jgi:hypothetical protein